MSMKRLNLEASRAVEFQLPEKGTHRAYASALVRALQSLEARGGGDTQFIELCDTVWEEIQKPFNKARRAALSTKVSELYPEYDLSRDSSTLITDGIQDANGNGEARKSDLRVALATDPMVGLLVGPLMWPDLVQEMGKHLPLSGK
jgi:hypothetical protein